MNVSGQLALTLVAAIGFAVLLISGEIDISIGSLLAFVALPLIQIMNYTESVWLGIIVCLLFGACIGLINGFLTIYLRIYTFRHNILYHWILVNYLLLTLKVLIVLLLTQSPLHLRTQESKFFWFPNVGHTYRTAVGGLQSNQNVFAYYHLGKQMLLLAYMPRKIDCRY